MNEILTTVLTNVSLTVIAVAFFTLCGVLAVVHGVSSAKRRDNLYRHQEKLEELRQSALKSNLIEHKQHS